MEKLEGLTYKQLSYARIKPEGNPLGYIICGDYYKAGTTHIFFDPREINLPDVPMILEEIAKKPNQKVHIFISGSKGDVVPNLPAFIAFLTRYPETPTTVVVHVPKKVPFLYEMTDMVLKSIEPKLKYKIIGEKKFASFRTHWPRMLDIAFTDDGIIANIVLRKYDYPKTANVDKKGRHTAGPLCDPTMRESIELFKPQIIEAFKKETPDGILKSFNNDDEIWDFITKNGEWSVRIEDKKEGKDNGDHK